MKPQCSDEHYRAVNRLFFQHRFMLTFLRNVKDLELPTTGDWDMYCWRYVFPRDITTKKLTTYLSVKLGMKQLKVVEVIYALKLARTGIDELFPKKKGSKYKVKPTRRVL